MCDEDTGSSISEGSRLSLSDVVSGVTDIASNVTHSVGGVVHTVTAGMGDVVHNVSEGVGGTVHQVTCGVKRLLTLPPDTLHLHSDDDDDDERPGALPPTPRNTSLSPTPSDTLSTQSPETDPEVVVENAVINTQLGLTEDHFSKPEESIHMMNAETVNEKIEICKNLILQCDKSTTRRRTLVHKLIQLRLRLQELHEVAEICSTGIVVHKNHQLQPQKPPLTHTSKQYCDKCAHIIWGLIHLSYICILCEYRCHGRCVDGIMRRCASIKANEDSSYILKICPEVGLSAQNYKCAECTRLITNNFNVVAKRLGKSKCKAHAKGVSCIADPFTTESAWNEPRRCDYSGRYYCPACHWNSRMVIPARVIHNWDFEERTISREARQLLKLMQTKPLLHLQKLNPHLFKFVEELNTVKKMREDILVMKQYLGTCRTAQESRMLRQLEERQHFVDTSYMYSIKDLEDVHSGILPSFLNKVHHTFSKHIKQDCLTCQGKGFICEICDVSEILFPFDVGVIVCNDCCTVLHHHCYTSRSNSCPRCLRRRPHIQ